MNKNNVKWNVLATIAVMAAVLAGCESSDSDGDYWTTKSKSSQQATTTENKATPNTQSTASNAVDDTFGSPDEMSFGAFSWNHGGFYGGHAVKSSLSIGGLRTTSDTLYFSWTGDTLASWGMGHDNADAVACFFVQQTDGAWVGGKFDWVSTSRTSRNIGEIYHGWGLVGRLARPCPCAYVIVSGDGRKRSNVITGSWSW